MIPSTKKATPTESVVQPVVEDPATKRFNSFLENLKSSGSDLKQAKAPPPNQSSGKGTVRSVTRGQVEKAASMSVFGRVTNARFLSDASIAQATGEVPAKLKNDITVPTDKEERNTYREGVEALSALGLIPQSKANSYLDVDNRVREIEGNQSLDPKQKETQIDSVRAGYNRKYDPRGLKDRLGDYDPQSDMQKPFERVTNHSGVPLDLSVETKLRVADAFGEKGATDDATIRDAKTGRTTIGVTQWPTNQKGISLNSDRSMLNAIAEKPSVDEIALREAEKLAAEEGYKPKPNQYRRIGKASKTEPTIHDKLTGAWFRAANNISEATILNRGLRTEQDFADARMKRRGSSFGKMEVADKNFSQDEIINDEARSNKYDDINEGDSEIVANMLEGDGKVGSSVADGEKDGGFIKGDTARSAALREYSFNQQFDSKRNAVRDTAEKDALSEIDRFAAIHGGIENLGNVPNVERLFVKHMAQKSVANGKDAASNPFSMPSMTKTGGAEYKRMHAGDPLHTEIGQALDQDGGVESLVTRYAKFDASATVDNDMAEFYNKEKGVGDIVGELEAKAKFVGDDYEGVDVIKKDARELKRYHFEKQRQLERAKISYANAAKTSGGLLNPKWVDGVRQYEGTSNFNVRPESDVTAEISGLESKIADAKRVLADPKIPYGVKKQAGIDLKSYNAAYEAQLGVLRERVAGEGGTVRMKREGGNIQANVPDKVDTQQVLDEVLAMADKPVKPAALRTTLRRKPN